MTKSEFQEWFKRHCGANPALANWMAENGGVDAILPHWFRGLQGVSVEHANMATDAMFRDDGEDAPFGRHVARIRALRWTFQGRERFERLPERTKQVDEEQLEKIREEYAGDTVFHAAMSALRAKFGRRKSSLSPEAQAAQRGGRV